MKKILKLTLLTIILQSLFLSCENDENTIELNRKNTTYSNMSVSEFSYYNEKEQIHMLEFESKDDFVNMIDLLESENDLYQESFYSRFDKEFEKDSSFYVIESDYNFDNQKIFKDFEKQYHYTSMRTIAYDLECDWLEKCEYDTIERNISPFAIYPYSTAEQTLFNRYGEVKIGDSILKVMDGEFVVFGDGDTVSLQKLHKGDTTVLYQDGVLSSFKYKSSNDENCKKYHSEPYLIHPLLIGYEASPIFKTEVNISFYNYWFMAKTTMKAKFFVWSSTQNKYVPAGTEQIIAFGDTKLYNKDCFCRTNTIIGGTKTKTRHNVELSKFILHSIDVNRVHKSDPLNAVYTTGFRSYGIGLLFW